MLRVQADLARNPTAFWKYISNLRTKGGFDPCVMHEGHMHTGPAAAEAFANYFSSVFLKQSPTLNTKFLNTNSNHFLVNITKFSPDEVESQIDKLKPRSSVGPDNVPPYIVKAIKSLLAIPLAYIFNLAVESGTYPRRWKQSRVVPILKSGDKALVNNYRPIAILSTLGKVFEGILHNKIYKQIEPYLSNSQHAFRKGRSVNTNLLTLVEYISQEMDAGNQVDVIYLDFRKAFDQVDNDILLEKLDMIGFAPKLLNLFADYLGNREQFVRLGCYNSTAFHTRSGVSQGSSLGPLLFSIMINDLDSCLTSGRCLIYADDVKIFKSIRSVEDVRSLQHDLDEIQLWSAKNRLYLNTSKCNVMSYTRSAHTISLQYSINQDPIARTLNTKDLGVLFDSKLTFHDHMRNLAAECFKRLGFVNRTCKDFTNIQAITLLYNALIRSKIEASSMIWNPHEKVYTLMLEKVQKRFLRFLYKKKHAYYPYLYPTKFLQGTLGFHSLETRRLHDQLLTIYRVLHGILDCPNIVSEASRLYVPEQRCRFRSGRVPLFAPTPARTSARQRSPICCAQRHLNAMITSQPQCDVFADKWSQFLKCSLMYCEQLNM